MAKVFSFNKSDDDYYKMVFSVGSRSYVFQAGPENRLGKITVLTTKSFTNSEHKQVSSEDCRRIIVDIFIRGVVSLGDY